MYWCSGTGKRDKLTKGTDSILVCLLETCLKNSNNLLRTLREMHFGLPLGVLPGSTMIFL